MNTMRLGLSFGGAAAVILCVFWLTTRVRDAAPFQGITDRLGSDTALEAVQREFEQHVESLQRVELAPPTELLEGNDEPDATRRRPWLHP